MDPNLGSRSRIKDYPAKVFSILRRDQANGDSFGPPVGVLRFPFGKDQLEQLQIPGTKSAGAYVQVEFPHSVKPFGIALFYFRPSGVKVLEPAHQRTIVIGSEVVDILNQHYAFQGSSDVF